MSFRRRLERVEREAGSPPEKILVAPTEYRALVRLHDGDRELFEAYCRQTYGHRWDPWAEAGRPAPSTERVHEARRVFRQLEEENIRDLAERTGDRLVVALWQVYDSEREAVRSGAKEIDPLLCLNHNLWLFDPEWTTRHRRALIGHYLYFYKKEFQDRERALYHGEVEPLRDEREAERLAREITAKHERLRRAMAKDRARSFGVPYPYDENGDRKETHADGDCEPDRGAKGAGNR